MKSMTEEGAVVGTLPLGSAVPGDLVVAPKNGH